MFKQLTESEVKFSINAIPENDAIEDHFDDAEIVAQVKSDAEHNLWAWCCIAVKAEWEGYIATVYLGGCSYSGEAEFRCDEYFNDMKKDALDLLNRRVEREYYRLQERRVVSY